MGNVVNNKSFSDADEFETPEDSGAKRCVVIAGFLFPAIGFGLLGYEIGGNFLALTGVAAGGVTGIVFNRLFSQIAKWLSLIGLAGIAIYGTIATLL